MPPPENQCGMNVECPGISDNQLMQSRLFWIDFIREITRNVIGAMVIPGIIYLLYRFVQMAPDEDKMNVMLLVIGYMGGLVTGISTWYFGGAMKSAVQQALTQTKGGPPNVIENPPPPVVVDSLPGVNVPGDVVRPKE
jgi:hypothetical protein